RLYRTGDLGRRRADGEIEFLGRADHQVKVRGYRVELGEIEAVLRSHEKVREAVVLLREDAPGQKRLVAYVVPEAGAEPSSAELRTHVAEQVPEYMVPGAFVAMDRLPTMASGKVDRRLLPAPEPMEDEEYVGPRTLAEELLAGIWAEVLKLERVGVEEGFFELGGYSLLATQVVARARQAFGVEVPLRALFEAPTVAGLAARIEALRSAGAPPAPPMERVPRTDAMPVSFAQQRLWVVDRLEPGSPAYNMPYALRLRGSLDSAALRASLDALVARHETLRTTFAEHEGGPVQVIHPPAPVPLPELDLRDLPEAEREGEALRLAAEEALRPFDLARGPLLRATLLRLAADDHVLCFTLHHVVSDGWSRGVLVREVSALYAAALRGEAARLPELEVQYADFAVWQRRWLAGATLEAQLGFWRERLDGAPPLLEIPTDRPRALGLSALSASHAFALPAGLSHELRAISRREGTTLFMTTLAAWQTLLGRYAGQDDVVVGSPIAGRTRRETEGLIGFFVNMLALRADLGGDPTWAELLGRVREAALGAFEHQELPFERLVEELVTERSLTHSPVFQATFELDRASALGGLALGELAAEPFGAGEGAAKFDLGLAFQDTGSGLAGTLTYRAGLFEAATIERMAGHMEAVVEALAADPGRRLAELSLLRGAERVQLLEEWTGTARPYPGLGVHEQFQAQAARTPAAAALVAGDESLSYAELEARSNQLARHLAGLGVGPETRVGVCAERSPELVVALLAVLKAGAAYVPLDPSYPAERLAYVLEDSGVPVLLTQERLLEHVPAHGARVVCLDRDAGRVDAGSAEPLPLHAEPESLAYVIYTSGSTGTPKGVGVPHRALANHMGWMQRAFPLAADDRVLQKTPAGFDASVWEFWAPLLAGATLVMAPRDAHRDPAELVRTVASERITVLQVVPTLLGAMLDEGGLERCASLRRLFCGGEALQAEPAARARALLGAEVVNLYGPTEVCIDATSHAFAGREAGATVPIGRPVDNVTTRVLDPRGMPVPVGVAGELHLGGAQLARGYLGRPELTAERFVPDALAGTDHPGARTYRTGDRVRWLPTGELEFLGRVDAQVKVRGFRIELGEVEAVLAAVPGVRESAVVVREDAPGNRRLVAYVAGEVEVESLRTRLHERLPEYMVPGAFVALERLPLNANGKLDRRALPAPAYGSAEDRFVAPRTAAEEVLAGIWSQVLGVERVGVEEGFFDLGGHSLLATQVASRARRAFGVEVPLRALFEARTVAGLAARIEALRSTGASSAPPMERVPRTEAMPASFAQQRLWVVDRLEPGSAAYNMAGALRLRGPLDPAALRAGLDALVARHETLRTTFSEQGGVPVQVIHAPAPVPLPTLDLGALSGDAAERTAERLAGAEAVRPFDLARGPLLRSTLLRLAADDHVLCFTMHHVVSDGWSMQVLEREVSALYAALSRGEDAHLPGLPVQYADFAVWQRGWLAGDVLEAQVDFWRERLAGAPPLLEIPTDRPRTLAQGARAGSYRFTLPAEVSDGLRALSRQQGATLFMTTLAAWQALLGRYAGQDDVVVGSPIAGRSRQETEGLIGFFVNMLALRADLAGDPTWSELLSRTAETALGAYEHQDLPFERLVEALDVERSLTHSPVFQVTFALNRDAGAAGPVRVGEVVRESFGAGAGVAKFELELTLADTGDDLRGELVHRASLFEAATVERMAAHLEVLLGAMAADPARRIGEASLLRGAERVQLLEEWTDTARAYPDLCLHELVAAQAARTPGAVALVAGDESLSYAELEARSNQLARHLHGLGAGPEVRVGVCAERSPELVVALLAVLKAGAAYVPLDPSYPAERLAYMLEDSGVPVLLTQERLLERMPTHGARVVCLDRDAGVVAAESAEPLPLRADADSLAYVIYTSGSTGRPKGAMNAHRGIVNRLLWMQDEYELTSDDVVLQKTPFSFDVSVWEFFWPLLTGARLVLA
ncbi:MAG: amino acid adenylation domain-containing protein, partial [Longimicrobiaceae bacterium]